MLLFDRKIQILVGAKNAPIALSIDKLRINATITKTMDSTADSAKVTVWNTNHKLLPKDKYIIIKAGYQNTVSAIFFGDITSWVVERKEADKATQIEAHDGGSWIASVLYSVSYVGAVTTATIINDMQKSLSIPTRYGQVPEVTYQRGFSFVGRAKDLLDILSIDGKFKWALTHGNLKIVPFGVADTEQSFDISPQTGLISIPATKFDDTDKVYRTSFTTLFLPIEPGNQLRLNGSRYKAEKLVFNLDTHESAFSVDVTATELI